VFCANPAAVVKEDTMLVMSSPEPMPVEEMSELPEFVAVDEIAEPMTSFACSD